MPELSLPHVVCGIPEQDCPVLAKDRNGLGIGGESHVADRSVMHHHWWQDLNRGGIEHEETIVGLSHVQELAVRCEGEKK